MTITAAPVATDECERVVLGALMIQPAVFDEVSPLLRSAYFYRPSHVVIYAAIVTLAGNGEPFDVAAVMTRLMAEGTLDRVGGAPYLHDLVAAVPTVLQASWHARQIAERAFAREIEVFATRLGMAASSGLRDRIDDAFGDLQEYVLRGAGGVHTWIAENIEDILDGNRPKVFPALGHRSDGVPLIYRAKEHSIAGEPEAGKTWFALMCVVDILKRDGRVVYVDFEDDASTVVGRLLDLGVLPKRLRAETGQFRYVRPEQAPGPGDILSLITFSTGVADLLVYDGWTEGASLMGLKVIGGEGQDDVAKWRQYVIRPALSVGTATLVTDHVVKSKDNQNRFAIGAQHKLAGLTGVQFMIEVGETWGRGARGRSSIFVTKDRNGGLRPHGKPDPRPNWTYLGDLVGDASSGDMESVVLWPPTVDDVAGVNGKRPPKALDKAVSGVRKVLAEHGTLSKNQIEHLVGGRRDNVRASITWLELNGEISIESGPNNSQLVTTGAGSPVRPGFAQSVGEPP